MGAWPPKGAFLLVTSSIACGDAALPMGAVDAGTAPSTDGSVAVPRDVGVDVSSAGPFEFNASVSVLGDFTVRNGRVSFVASDSPLVGPELHWIGNRGGWITGIDVANNGGSRDFVVAAKKNWPQSGVVNDLLYISHNGENAPTIGAGVTPPNGSHRLQVSGQDDEPAMGALQVRRTPDQTGNLISAVDSGGALRWWLDSNYWLAGNSPSTGASVSIRADAANHRPLALGRSDGSTVYGFQYENDASGTLHLRYMTGGVNNISLRTDGTPHFPNGLTTTALTFNAAAARVPSSSASPCARGEIAFDENFVYVCVASNSWKRSQLTSW